MHNKESAEILEVDTAAMLRDKGIEVKESSDGEEDGYFDLVANGIPVEIKSSKVFYKNGHKATGKKPHYNTAHFDFKSPGQLKKLKENYGWVCFYITWRSEKILLGFVRATELSNYRRIAVTALGSCEIYKFDDFVNYLKSQGKVAKNAH